MTGPSSARGKTHLPNDVALFGTPDRDVREVPPLPALRSLRRAADGGSSSSDIRDGDGRLPRYLTVREFAEVARISRATAYRLIHSGAVPVTRFGRRVVIPRDIVLDGVVVDTQPNARRVASRSR